MNKSQAGRKGGQKTSQDRQHMSDIGRKGGEQSHGSRSSSSRGRSSQQSAPSGSLQTRGQSA